MLTSAVRRKTSMVRVPFMVTPLPITNLSRLPFLNTIGTTSLIRKLIVRSGHGPPIAAFYTRTILGEHLVSDANSNYTMWDGKYDEPAESV